MGELEYASEFPEPEEEEMPFQVKFYWFLLPDGQYEWWGAWWPEGSYDVISEDTLKERQKSCDLLFIQHIETEEGTNVETNSKRDI